ncbi:MAG: DEAD/DEAH box helicase family protein, partial [Bacteroidota bacterium]
MIATKLRPYQEKAVEAAMEFLSRPRKRSEVVKPGILVAPTAAGKSHILAAIAGRLNRVLILQPSLELLRQNLGKYIQNGGVASVYSAGANMRQIGNVTYATLGTVKALGHLFEGFTLLIDEAHLYPPSGESMLGKFMAASGITRVLGLTATPFRLKSYRNSSELKFITRTRPRFFKEVVHVIQVSEMTENGYWSRLRYKSYNFQWTGLKAKRNGSDFTEKSMLTVWERQGMDGVIREIVARMIEHGRKSILVFVPSVKNARQLAATIPGAAAVWGDMKKENRDSVIISFKNG